MSMQFWLIQTLNSLALGGVLFLLASGFSLIFGLMRIPNLAHGALFMLGAYLAASALSHALPFGLAVLLAGLIVGSLGTAFERFILRKLAGNERGQVLVTLGVSFIIADFCLFMWTGDPIAVPAPEFLRRPLVLGQFAFPAYRIAVLVVSVVVAVLLYLLIERSKIGAMIRAGVDDMQMARGVGIPVSKIFSLVFFLGAALAGIGGAFAGPILSAYPGLDGEMLPLALVVVVLGGVGSLFGAFIGSFVIAAIYNFGTALLPDLSYVILFLPMVITLVLRPQGLFGKSQL